MMPIDYVIPFVDSSDREWVSEYRKYIPADCTWSSNATRFRDWDLLRYQLRSISRTVHVLYGDRAVNTRRESRLTALPPLKNKQNEQ